MLGIPEIRTPLALPFGWALISGMHHSEGGTLLIPQQPTKLEKTHG